jgi:hypothetical protein
MTTGPHGGGAGDSSAVVLRSGYMKLSNDVKLGRLARQVPKRRRVPAEFEIFLRNFLTKLTFWDIGFIPYQGMVSNFRG